MQMEKTIFVITATFRGDTWVSSNGFHTNFQSAVNVRLGQVLELPCQRLPGEVAPHRCGWLTGFLPKYILA